MLAKIANKDMLIQRNIYFGLTKVLAVQFYPIPPN